jgi:hypothetical protein
MESAKKIEGIDRYLLVSSSLILVDLPQIGLYASGVLWIPGWVWGILGSIIFGCIMNLSFNVSLFGPRMGMKTLAYFLCELIPGLSAITLLSVGLLIITYFHNSNIDKRETEGADGEV